MPIRQLPAVVVNQIAAGEVVERPASVVKETIENALDAGATHIEVLVEGGGIDRIDILDDGCGIPMEELPAAVASHATSKVSSLEDLQHIATMGFRGEALASIGSVARLEIRSRPREQDAGSVIVVDHGDTSNPTPAPCPPGTRVVISGLFGRIPARRKFLKTAQAETTRIRRVIRDCAAANPEVSWLFASGGRTLLDLSVSTPRKRLEEVLGSEMSGDMLEINDAEGDISVWGLVGRPALARPTAQHQLLCLNGRPIVDRSLRFAVREAFRGLIEPNRHPTCAIFLSVPSDRVDVNVHPAKTEVRFRDDRLVFSLVRRALEATLSKADIVPSMRRLGEGSRHKDRPTPSSTQLFGARSSTDQSISAPEARAVMASAAQTAEVPVIDAARPALQIHRMFIVTEDAEGMLIIDQHALHERVMFERLLSRISTSPLPSQRLLVPEMIDAEPQSIEALISIGDLVERLGFDVVQGGPSVLVVHAVPSLLAERRVSIGPFMIDLLDRASSLLNMADEETALRDVLDMMACKAAIKAGEALSDMELADLLRMRETVERSSNCPHGRPTTIRLTIEDLERRFGRR